MAGSELEPRGQNLSQHWLLQELGCEFVREVRRCALQPNRLMDVARVASHRFRAQTLVPKCDLRFWWCEGLARLVVRYGGWLNFHFARQDHVAATWRPCAKHWTLSDEARPECFGRVSVQ